MRPHCGLHLCSLVLLLSTLPADSLLTSVIFKPHVAARSISHLLDARDQLIGTRGGFHSGVRMMTPSGPDVGTTLGLGREKTLDEGQEGAQCYVVLSNMQSGGNIGRIVRSASIFGATELVVVGQRKWRLHGLHGYIGMPSRHFYTHEEAQAYLVGERSAEIIGVEIEEGAAPLMRYDTRTGVATFPFKGSSAFIMGNEGLGLSPGQRAICSSFVYIPHVRGGGGSASLNVACAAAVVLQAFALWAGFREAPRAGEQFGEGEMQATEAAPMYLPRT